MAEMYIRRGSAGKWPVLHAARRVMLEVAHAHAAVVEEECSVLCLPWKRVRGCAHDACAASGDASWVWVWVWVCACDRSCGWVGVDVQCGALSLSRPYVCHGFSTAVAGGGSTWLLSDSTFVIGAFCGFLAPWPVLRSKIGPFKFVCL